MLVFKVLLRPVIFGIFVYSYLLFIADSLQTNWGSILLGPLIILFLPIAVMEFFVSYIGMKLLGEAHDNFIRGLKKRILILYILYFTWVISVYFSPFISRFIFTDLTSFFKESVLILISRPLWFTISGLLVLSLASILFRKNSKGSFVFSLLVPPLFLLLASADFNFDITGGLQKTSLERSLKDARIYKYPKSQCDKHFLNRLQSSFKFPGTPLIDTSDRVLYLPVGTNLDYSGCPNIIKFKLISGGTLTIQIQNSNYPHRKLIPGLLLDVPANQLAVMPFTDWREMLMLNKRSLKLERMVSFRTFSKGALHKQTFINSTILDYRKRRAFISTSYPPSLIRVSLNTKYGTANTTHFAINDLSLDNADLYASLKNLIYAPKINRLYAYIVESGHRSKILEFNPKTLALLREIAVNHEISTIELDTKKDLMYAPLKWTKRILVVSRKNMKVTRTVSSPAFYIPMLRVDPERNLIYIVDYLRGRLIIMDGNLRKVLTAMDVGHKPQGMAMDKEGIYVASTLGVIRIKYKSLAIDSVTTDHPK